MRKVPARLSVALSPLVLFVIVAPSPFPVDSHQIQQGFNVEIEDRRKVTTRQSNPFDGTWLTGGSLSPAEAGCSAGVQGFFLQEDQNQTPVCQLYGNAGTECSGMGSGGHSLFGNLTNIYQEYIETSIVTDTAVNPANGDMYVAVNVQMAWRTVPANELEAAFGAIVLQVDAQCTVMAGLYLGPVPTGIPDTSAKSCDVLCAALAVEHPQYAIEALAFNASTLGLVGWYRAPAPDPTQLATKDLLISQLTLDLSTYSWGALPPFPGNDVGLDLAISDIGEFFATGYFGTARDIFLVRYGNQGGLLSVATAGGALDDQGSTIMINGESEIVIEGYFTDSATFGGQQITGAGPTAFTATYNYGLELLSVEVPDAGGNNGTSSAMGNQTQVPLVQVPPPSGSHDAPSLAAGLVSGAPTKAIPNQPATPIGVSPYVVELLKGEVGSSSAGANWVQQVKESEDVHLHLYGESVEDPDSDEAVSVTRYLFQIGPLATEIRTFKLEVLSDYCNVLTIDLARVGSSNIHTLPLIEICPLDEPVITVTIPQSVSTALGFSDTSGGILEATIHMSLNGAAPCTAPAGAVCSTNGKNSCIDEVEVGPDY